MDLKGINTSNWWILFGVLVIIPGSTLNVIERAAGTAEKAISTTSIPLVLKPVVPADVEVKIKKNSLKTYRKAKEISIAITSRAMNSKESKTVPTLARQLILDNGVKVKPSLTSLTMKRQEKEELSRQGVQGNIHKASEDVKFSIIPTTTLTKALINHKTKGSLSLTETVGKFRESTTEMTSKTIATIRNSSAKVAPATKKLTSPSPTQSEVKLFPLSSINNEYEQPSPQNTTDIRHPYRDYNIKNKEKCNYNYDYDKKLLVRKVDDDNRIVDEHDTKHICSLYQHILQTLQRHTFPLQRTQPQRDSPHSNDYHLINSNSKSPKLQTDSVRKIRQQRTRQVKQQQLNLTAIAPVRAMKVVPETENYLIGNDTDFKIIMVFSNQTVKNKTDPSRNSNIVPTILTTRPYSDTTFGLAFDQEIVHTTTKEFQFQTVSPTTTKARTNRPPLTTTPRPIPSIDDHQTVISQAGTHAYLPCNVKQILRKPISWLRIRDGHILTVDQTTFIADQRFQPIFAPKPDRWSLQIKYVQLKDEGTYECQVSTEPKSSAIVTLRVVEAKTELIGEPTQHVKAGSQVKLRCIISQALDPPVFINWFHNHKQIYLHSRRGWRTEIERIEWPLHDFSTTAEATTSTAQGDSATTTTPPFDTAAAASAKPKAPVLATNFENEENSTPVVQTSVRDAKLTTGTPSTTLPISRLGTDVAMDLADSDGGFDFGTDNSTLSFLPTVAAAVDIVPAVVPTKVKTTHCPTTTLTITTTITMLAAVKVRDVTAASLIIPSVEKNDSGNYTCSPSNSAPKTVVLHVLNGEYSASAITSGVNDRIRITNQCKWREIILALIIWQWHQKFTAFLRHCEYFYRAERWIHVDSTNLC
ncbi:uncharacterized protein LOC120766348 [Bactrocera tryoni]|uniref:uncharacterized protein LOC120766348 n=1 Tax=Bactrocera tryoni TaxID=59916 RepID=UPI001A977C21|nr:uncharacterized protein LOC120766348 [Bactrocera tryoni]XP_039947709.1 uncharacterized protein LOC120766348 [Bactrocera tryoni]XP_039947710.1 uncharacterized protein LOC120766348 [Bactrocera tryoni]XP_039947711.1 uncharacterized protein LOC120766348 [Bactrocera tryoni]